MTQENASPATDTGLPEISDILTDMLILRGLCEAADMLSDGIGSNPRGGALFSVIVSALPLAQKIAADLERIN